MIRRISSQTALRTLAATFVVAGGVLAVGATQSSSVMAGYTPSDGVRTVVLAGGVMSDEGVTAIKPNGGIGPTD
jgi:hypothetical protein